jgi:fructokinase
MTRFVVCGETLIDLIRSPEGPQDASTSTWSALSAGGPMNSAVALGRLGVPTHFLGRLSTDTFGQQLRSYIDGARVHLDLAVESSQATSLAIVSLDQQGVASYTFHFADTANFGWQPDELPALMADDWLHIASLSCVVSPGAEVLLDWMRTIRAGVSYDINVRPNVISDPALYWKKVEPWLQVVGGHGGIVRASDEDINFLPNGRSANDPLAVAADWVRIYGLSLAVITLGSYGAVGVEANGKQTRVPGVPTEVVDTVGAGDTFMASFLDSRINRELPLEESLNRGVAAASIVCSRRGANPPTAAEVDDLVARARVG